MGSNQKRPNQALNDVRQALASRIAKWITSEELVEPPIPGMEFHKYTTPTVPTNALHEPSICLVVQGVKRVQLNEAEYVYDANNYLFTSVNLPIIANILEARPEVPFLGITWTLDLRVVAQLIADSDLPPQRNTQTESGVALGEVTPALLNIYVRALDLLDTPEEIPILAPLIHKELLYRLLVGDQGDRLRQLAKVESHSRRISKAIDWLLAHYSEAVRMEDLASHVGMSPSTFNHHFRAVTAMSPLQFQKWMRLQEARKLMLSENKDAATVLKRFGVATVATLGFGCTAISRQGDAKSIEDSRGTYKVYSSGKIGNMKLKNRFVKAATATESTNSEGRFMPEGLVFYRNWSKGGVGLIETGHMTVVPVDYHGMVHHLGQIWSDKQIPFLKELTNTVHRADPECKIVAFLNHLGNHPVLAHGQGGAASAQPWPGQKKLPRTLSRSEIQDVTQAFANAAVRAKKAGFDGVTLQGGHKFLLHSFLSPQTNKRKDEYGGSLENRVRIIKEIVDKIKTRAGSNFPVIIKVNSYDSGPGGVNIDNFPQLAAAIAKAGVDAIELSGGVPSVPDIDDPTEQSYHAAYAKKLDVDVPVILTGGNKDIDIMERLFKPGKIDFFGIARPLIRQPELPNLWLDKGADSECTCVSCNECLRYHVFEGNPFLSCQLD